MAKKSKKQQDDQEREDQFIELPDDRLEQLERSNSQQESEEKTQSKVTVPHEKKQAERREEAPEKAPEKREISSEDLLADVRRTLVTEEEVVEEPKGLFARIKNRLKKKSKDEVDAEKPQAQFEFDVEAEEDVRKLIVEPKPQKRKSTSSKQEEIAIKEFFSDLEALADVVTEEPTPTASDVQAETLEDLKPEEKVKVPKLPVKSEKDEVDFEAFREMALQEYDETKIEVEERKAPLQEDVRQTIRELKPFERVLLIAVGILTVGALLASGIYIIVDSISIPTPTPTVEPNLADIVHPIRLSLPGGWEFPLGEGRVNEGKWAPASEKAEWLVGTEISRWVALPWSLQLEAVLRTLKAGDQIELTMSNFDILVFNVYSIQEMTMDKLLASDPTKPSLLIVLYNDEEADGTFWVVTALPE